jgi:hypothetical protein
VAEGHGTLIEPPHPLVGALIAALPSGSRVLLIGVGSGRHIPPLLQAGFRVDVLDEDSMRTIVDGEPFNGGFDGALSTHALLHGTPESIQAALRAIGDRLRDGAPFHLTLGSKADPRFGAGTRIDDATWAAPAGTEAGVPHAYFDEGEVRALLIDWDVLDLEQRNAAETAGRWAHRPSELATMVHWFARIARR